MRTRRQDPGCRRSSWKPISPSSPPRWPTCATGLRARRAGLTSMFTSELPLLDHHCHGVVAGPLQRARFEDLATESSSRPAAGTTHLDSPLGLMIRRWCAPILDLEPFASNEEYVERRLAIDPPEVNRRFLQACGLSSLLLDTGYRSADILDPAGMASAAGVPAHEVVRIETVAEATLAAGGEAGGFFQAYAGALSPPT